jgi:hypothetical protein
MERLKFSSAVCAICGGSREEGETWFLISENCWEDRLKIWRWEPQTAGRSGMHSVCGKRHVRELVVHWMTTGCLYYPFATTPSCHLQTEAVGLPPVSFPVPHELGELAVDREAVRRALRDNPYSLNTILEELTIALESECCETLESEPEDEGPVFRTV